MSDILERIVAAKRQEIVDHRARQPERDLEKLIASDPHYILDFRAALERGPGIGIIAEIKKASPSAGVLRADFVPANIALTYLDNGANAISVLTDQAFFQGSVVDLAVVACEVGGLGIPVLRKDFILDRYQVLEARACGADAVLLIAEILGKDELPGLLRYVHEVGMQALVEIYERDNLKRVIDAGAKIIGVNNRNLRTFVTILDHTIELVDQVPADCCLVSESGIRTRADIERLEAAGVKAALIGETFMRAPDIGAKLRELRGVP